MGTWRPSRDTVIWAFVIAILLTAQWPMLKGTWYKRFGGAPPASSIPWRTDFVAALAEAKRTDRPVLVDFAAGWCPPCITMQHDVWPDPEIAAAVARGYIPLMVDVDRFPEVAGRYEVVGIPSVLVIDADGRVVRRASFLSAGGMKRFLAGDE